MTEIVPHSDQDRMSLSEHLDELRKRIIYALIGFVVGLTAALASGKYLIALFKRPYQTVMTDTGRSAELIVLSATGGFITYLKVSLIIGLVIASPWIFYQLWMFVAAGLYPKERKRVLQAVPFSAGLFLCGAACFLFVVAIPVLKFFVDFNDWLGLNMAITFQSYVGMMSAMMIVFGLAFQLPLAMLILAKVGLIDKAKLTHYRPHAVIGILIVSMTLTPPDPISQIALAIPMYLLYELGIVLVKLFVRKPAIEAQ